MKIHLRGEEKLIHSKTVEMSRKEWNHLKKLMDKEDEEDINEIISGYFDVNSTVVDGEWNFCEAELHSKRKKKK